jgi:hypothetical protein
MYGESLSVINSAHYNKIILCERQNDVNVRKICLNIGSTNYKAKEFSKEISSHVRYIPVYLLVISKGQTHLEMYCNKIYSIMLLLLKLKGAT